MRLGQSAHAFGGGVLYAVHACSRFGATLPVSYAVLPRTPIAMISVYEFRKLFLINTEILEIVAIVSRITVRLPAR